MQINAAEIRSAQAQLAMTPVAVRNRALVEFSRLLKKNAAEVLRANGVDVRAAQRAQLTSAFLDRLMLNHKRLEDMAAVLREVASASDPLGRSSKVKTLKNGLKARKITRPLGVIFLIFESRPNVAVESFALALKSGNALILKGGRESAATIKVLEKLMQRALKNV
ncbi:MAG TPA: aldehyde dehydrogenase family protein, partial [Oligoflexia bacterium]|nr:aldehyde dehydrogenase family protein [Oligoflexia bacterium]